MERRTEQTTNARLTMMRLLTEGAIALYEGSQCGTVEPSIAYDTIGAALYELRDIIEAAQKAETV